MGADIYDLVEGLALERANTGEYFGEIAGQPAILTILSSSPPGVMFKIRINSEDKHDVELGESLAELMETKKINVSFENGYGWLTVYDLSDFEAEDVFDLLADFIHVIEEHGLSLGMGCAICKRSDSGEVYYSESKINRLCPACLMEKGRQQSEKNKKLLDVKASSVWLSLLGMTGFAVAWVSMWLLYDYMFVLYGKDEIQVSDYALVGGALIAVAILAMTIGLPLRRFGIQNSVLLTVIASVFVIVSFVLGEILLAMILVMKAFKSFTIVASVGYYIYSWQSQLPLFKVVKIGLVVGAVIGVHFIAKKKKTALEI